MEHSPAKIFEALGDPVRRYILELVATGEQSVSAITSAVRQRSPISQPGVSQHLKVLRDAGLVRVRADGTRRLYRIETDGLHTALTWLSRIADPLAPFTQPLDALTTEIARGKRARRISGPGADTGAETGRQAGHA
ncbi:ArsR/SmtB family transcription factor [Nocardia sp. 004]|uniref:ArsR/SmtB family transcription factor n=1 Tax=Nocardia sp. 004 TaxID=3385978 RepID=UPI00399F5B4A